MNPHIDLDAVARHAFSAVVSDICDQLGYRNQTLPNRMTPRTRVRDVVVGFARPVQTAPVAVPPSSPYGAEIDFIDSLQPDDVVVADCSGSLDAFWGELFSTASKARGARGAIIDGAIRDVHRIEAVGFAVHSSATSPSDSLGRLSIIQQDRPIQIGGVLVTLGDFIVADADGAVVVPAAIASEVASRALEKAQIESSALEMLRNGSTLRHVWDTHHVL